MFRTMQQGNARLADAEGMGSIGHVANLFDALFLGGIGDDGDVRKEE